MYICFSETQDDWGSQDVDPINWPQLTGTIFTLTNSAVGSSLLTIPIAFNRAGLIGGIVLIALLLCLARFVEWRLIKYSRKYKKDTYSSMIAAALGNRIGTVLSLLIFISLFIGLVGLLVLIGDLVTPMAQSLFGSTSINRSTVMVVVSLLTVVPLGTLPNVGLLRYSSSLTVFSLIFVTISVIIRYFHPYNGVVPVPNGQIVYWNWSWSFIQAPPLIWYNCGFIFQSIPALGPFRRQYNRYRIGVVFAVVSVLTFALLTSIGIPGYLTFFSTVKGNILTNYSVEDPLIAACNALIGIVVLCTYPLFNMPLRESLVYLIRQYQQYRDSSKPSLVLPSSASNDGKPVSLDSTELSKPTQSDIETSNNTSVDDSEISNGSLHQTNEHNDEEMVSLDLDDSHLPRPKLSEEEIVTSISQGISDTVAMNTPMPHLSIWYFTIPQSVLSWVLAFAVAYVVPDITTIIGFVGSSLSPLYYLVFPALIVIYMPLKKSKTIVGAVFMISIAVYFEVAGFAKNFT